MDRARELTTSQLTPSTFATAETDIFSTARQWENPAGGAAGSGGFRSSDPVYALAEHRYRTAVLLADEPR